jgi:predicted dehydrogenase
VRIIQVGAGAWGASWSEIVARSQDWELAALVDLDPTALQAVAAVREIPNDKCFSQLSDALEAGVEADAALIVSPPPAHAPVAADAFKAGLHCLIEKPLADTLDAAKDIVRRAERDGLHVMVSQNYRFKRAPRTVQRLIQEGWLGRIGQVRVNFQKLPPFSGFRTEMEEPLIVDMTIHHLDQIRGIVGLEPVVLRAKSWNPPWSRFGGNASALIELQTAEGAEVIYTGSWSSHSSHTTWDGSWEIEGDGGGLTWADNRVQVRFASVFDTVFMPRALERSGVMEVELEKVDFEERSGTLAEFARAISSDTSAETNGRDNLRSLGLVLAAVDSAKHGGREIDLGDFVGT